MSERRVAKRYIDGFLRVVQEQNCMDEVERGFEKLDALIVASASVRDVLCHPTIPRRRKKDMLRRLLGTDVHELFLRFVEFVIDKKREQILPEAYGIFRDAADSLRGVVRGRIRSAAALTEAQEQRLGSELTRLMGKKVVMDYETDTGLLGGMQLFVGSYIIDGSLTGRLNRLHKHLLAGVG